MNKFEMAKLAVSKMAGRGGLLTQKYSPEILIGMGISGIVMSTIMACRATLKVEDVLNDTNMKLEEIKYGKEVLEPAKYSDMDYKKDLAITYTKTGVELIKLYGPSLLVGTASVACILGAHNIMKGRNLALVAAYKTIEQGFNNYRDRVVEELGEDKDRQFKLGITEESVTEIEKDEETGKSKKVKKSIESADPNKFSAYAKFFDEACANWSKNPEYNAAFLRAQQNYANDLLHSRGHIFLNEVYDMLGIDRTGAGAMVGWVMSKDNGDNYVDFGIYDMNNPAARRFVNGAERSILLDFNVDGVIYDLI